MKLTLKNPLGGTLLVNQRFGTSDPKYSAMGIRGHDGIDLWSPHGTPVYAAHDGMGFYEIDGGGGHGVVLLTDKPFDYQGGEAYFKTVYWHLCDSLKEPQYRSPLESSPFGKHFKAGELIGYADNTGMSTGDHLHFALKPVAKGEPNSAPGNIEQKNGYFGAIDPAPYMEQELPFLKDLEKGITDTEVLRLQRFLNVRGFIVSQSGPGSIGNETETYGGLTASAVGRFQQAHSVCSPGKPGYGRCGPSTRKSINAQLNHITL